MQKKLYLCSVDFKWSNYVIARATSNEGTVYYSEVIRYMGNVKECLKKTKKKITIIKTQNMSGWHAKRHPVLVKT